MNEILITEFLTALMIFVRITSMFMAAPVFSNSSIPILVKLALALVISYILLFNVEKLPFNPDMSLIELALMGIKEVITGLILGITLNLVFQGISFAGLYIGRDMGLVMSEMFDPSTESSGNVISSILSMAAILIFILINGHHFLIQSLAYSFKLIPIGHYSVNGEVYTLLIKYTGSIFVLAIKIASPIIVAFFLLHLAAGIISRVSPSFQVFFVLLPLKIVLGFILLVFVMPLYIYLFKNLILIYEDKLLDLVKAISY